MNQGKEEKGSCPGFVVIVPDGVEFQFGMVFFQFLAVVDVDDVQESLLGPDEPGQVLMGNGNPDFLEVPVLREFRDQFFPLRIGGKNIGGFTVEKIVEHGGEGHLDFFDSLSGMDRVGDPMQLFLAVDLFFQGPPVQGFFFRQFGQGQTHHGSNGLGFHKIVFGKRLCLFFVDDFHDPHQFVFVGKGENHDRPGGEVQTFVPPRIVAEVRVVTGQLIFGMNVFDFERLAGGRDISRQVV